jgi:hypothetical protein
MLWRERDWMIYVIVSKMGDIPSNAYVHFHSCHGGDLMIVPIKQFVYKSRLLYCRRLGCE